MILPLAVLVCTQLHETNGHPSLLSSDAKALSWTEIQTLSDSHSPSHALASLLFAHTTPARIGANPTPAFAIDRSFISLQGLRGRDKQLGNAFAKPRCHRPRMGDFLKRSERSVPDPDSKEAREAALVKWLTDNGVWLSENSGWGIAPHPLRVEADTIEDFEYSGRGLISRSIIPFGDVIVRIPQNLIITRDTAVKTLGKQIIPDSLGEYLAIALMLISERARGTESFWAPYIRILPTSEEVGQPWLWSEADLKLLTGSSVLNKTKSLGDKLWSDYELLWYEIIYPNGLDPEVFSFEAFQWAMSMLFSRAVNLKEVKKVGLVPYADLINHSPYVTSFFSFPNLPLSDEREVVLYSDRTYRQNDQVLISYGQKTNSDLLLLYGFTCDRNLFDEVDLTVKVDPSDPMYEQKVSFLENQGLQAAMSFPLLIDRYSSELLQYLRLCCITPDMGDISSFQYKEPISKTNERAALSALRDGCIFALSQYPESEEEDAALMKNTKMFAMLSFRQRQAIKLRRTEKTILLKTIRTVEVAIETLDGTRPPRNPNEPLYPEPQAWF